METWEHKFYVQLVISALNPFAGAGDEVYAWLQILTFTTH